MKKLSGNPYIEKEENQVFLDKIPLQQILVKRKTPFIIFLENRIRDNVNTFKNVFFSLFDNVECYYSLKANYLPDICKIINSEGLGAEVISLPELSLARSIGFPPNKILIGGPYLTKELIEKSVKMGVKEIILYNLNDIPKINKIAKRNDIIQDICIRVVSQKFESKLGIRINEENTKKLGVLLKNCNNLNIVSILSHHTSQMNNVDQFKNNVTNVIDTMKILRKGGISIKNINLGGGFPEATIMPKEQLKKIALSIKTTLEESQIEFNNVYFEPGRYFIGDAAVFITKIIKVTDNRWTFLNIGNHIIPKFARCSLRFYNSSRINDPHKYKTSFAGIIPTDQDVLAKNYFFTEILNEKDVVLVANVGAYTLTFSNRFPYRLPEIYLIKGEQINQIFNPRTDKDFSIY